tara:strand:+ start:2532 stop:3008 length:477 start_codon:yes stop_codon:yes gene_type:complete
LGTLAAETPKGQAYIQKEKLLADFIASKFNATAIELGSNNAYVDRLFYRNGKLVSIAEIKNRELSIEKLYKYNSYLISHDKIKHGAKISELLKVPYFIFVHLIRSGKIVYFQITNEEGLEISDYTIRQTETKADCNGSLAFRYNAFLSLDQMTVIDAL